MKAAQTGSVSFQDHLDTCQDCRELFDICSACERATRYGLEQPSDEAVAHHFSIPLKENTKNSISKLKGLITYDSWAPVPALQLRDTGRGAERRLRMESDDIILEFSAERQSSSWDFTARAYRKEEVASADYILKADGLEVTSSVQECYYWTSQQPPRRIRLVSPEVTVDFGYLRWK